MDPTRSNFYALSYSVPFLSLVVIYGFLCCLNRRASSFIHRSILGVEINTEDDDKSSQLKQFFFVPIDDDVIENSPPIPCWIRIVSDLLCSAILAVFVAIIFQNLILGFQSVSEGGDCPSFQSYCFPAGRSEQTTNYTCAPGSKVNFSSPSNVYYCFGFLYSTVDAKEVVEVVGICGGLMGVLSSIVPLVYYLTRQKACLCVSLSFILLPIGIIILMIVISRASFIGPEGLSTLSWIIFSLLIFMTGIAWIWGFIKSWQNTATMSSEKLQTIETCPFCYCFPPHREGTCCKTRSNCCESCQGLTKLCNRRYFYYPFCCLSVCNCKWKEFDKESEPLQPIEGKRN